LWITNYVTIILLSLYFSGTWSEVVGCGINDGGWKLSDEGLGQMYGIISYTATEDVNVTATVDWGDGRWEIIDRELLSGHDLELVHLYSASSGLYNITFSVEIVPHDVDMEPFTDFYGSLECRHLHGFYGDSAAFRLFHDSAEIAMAVTPIILL
jgi:hypothetical protein